MASKNVDTLHTLLHDTLRDTLDAERQITKALPKMAKHATNPTLKQGFEEHLRQTEEQIQRLEQAFQMIDKAPRGKHCKGMEGLIAEGDEMMQEHEPGDLLDAALIAAAQKVEHYEIAAYGTLCTYAGLLGMREMKDLLGQTLEEEKMTDEKLTQSAQKINVEAMQ
ncbi:ferritin-like domain-containing protein [bacterium]|nr:ferritin-like domain-containing protein [bacterium]